MSKDELPKPITIDVIGPIEIDVVGDFLTDITMPDNNIWDINDEDITIAIDKIINPQYDQVITNGDQIYTLSPQEFVHHMPSIEKIDAMCEEYPAMKEAWDNFRTMYEMVHQDWKDNNKR